MRFDKSILMHYIETHPGCTKLEMARDVCITKSQINLTVAALRESVKLVLCGSGASRIGRYYQREEEFVATVKPTLPGATVVHAGVVLRKKYGYCSPPLRKNEHRGVASAMGGDHE